MNESIHIKLEIMARFEVEINMFEQIDKVCSIIYCLQLIAELPVIIIVFLGCRYDECAVEMSGLVTD